MDASVGPYSIVRLINGGGQGQVYLGYDRRLRRQVAIKIHRLPRSRQARLAALAEARQLARMQDERVVRIHDVVESPDYLALVMEYVPGCDLEQLLSATGLSLHGILLIAADVAAALAVARQAGIVHGDLKAANVLITTQGRAKLSDFGISGSPHSGPAGRGSASAAAPEQLLGETLDVRTDLFALGRLLYRMLTGEHSFAVAGDPSLQALAQQGPPDVRSNLPMTREVPDALCALVQQLLQKSPGDRPQNTHPVRRELRLLSRSLPVSDAGSLLREAKPYFRATAPGDRPPQVPGQLSHAGRSRNARNAVRQRWMALLPGSRAGHLGLALVLGLAALAVALYLRPSPLSVHIRDPVLQVDAAAELAREIDASFLVSLAGAVLRERQSGVVLSGAVAPSALITGADRDGGTAREQLAIEVRCSSAFCLLNLQRLGPAVNMRHQHILFSDAPEREWREGVRRALAGLYP